ncbi:hypothetical protein GpartN1_g7039.t1 [Galdieria partita]|uniref:DUF866 domain-containing protein n=1 Tax=Galdieria partita TaxID=83374 RepID=A0A9C7UTU7_9RHOD|nr:hypothetical protein GpartN1_g6458.t1 [Galdieria partita]GJQ15248.1 hypothetical protein GpartN1_g7039.t1 [Galdieria partita]
MPIYCLEIKALCSPNIQKVTVENSYIWHLQLQCMHCSEKTGWIAIDPSQEMTRVRSGVCHVLLHCRFCSRQCTITVLEESHVYDNKEEFQPFASFDCRGLEPVDWNPIGDEFILQLNSGVLMRQVSLEEGEYYDYDENEKEEVSITCLEWQWKRV